MSPPTYFRRTATSRTTCDNCGQPLRDHKLVDVDRDGPLHQCPARKPSGPSGAHVSPRIKVSVDATEALAWTAAAERLGLTLADWIRGACRMRLQVDRVASRSCGTERASKVSP